LAAMEQLLLASPDQQISLTDPDSRSMATSGRGSGVVAYNVQIPSIQASPDRYSRSNKFWTRIARNAPTWPSACGLLGRSPFLTGINE